MLLDLIDEKQILSHATSKHSLRVQEKFNDYLNNPRPEKLLSIYIQSSELVHVILDELFVREKELANIWHKKEDQQKLNRKRKSINLFVLYSISFDRRDKISQSNSVRTREDVLVYQIQRLKMFLIILNDENKQLVAFIQEQPECKKLLDESFLIN